MIKKSSTGHGEKLRRFLKDKDESPEEFAVRVGRSKGTIYNWINKPILDSKTIQFLSEHGLDLILDKSLDPVLENVDNVGSDKTMASLIDGYKKRISILEQSIVVEEKRIERIRKAFEDLTVSHRELNASHRIVVESNAELIKSLTQNQRPFPSSEKRSMAKS